MGRSERRALETGLDEDDCPAACPYSLEQILAADFYPDGSG
ncbi:DUF29 domain-containing protein [Caldichromatium japonicum]|nr:DUF29 domain-containing protein [Caldichromatium japonicum]